MNKKTNITANTIINMVAKQPNATASTLNQYFQYYLLQEPSEEDIKKFEKKVENISKNICTVKKYCFTLHQEKERRTFK